MVDPELQFLKDAKIEQVEEGLTCRGLEMGDVPVKSDDETTGAQTAHYAIHWGMITG